MSSNIKLDYILIYYFDVNKQIVIKEHRIREQLSMC